MATVQVGGQAMRLLTLRDHRPMLEARARIARQTEALAELARVEHIAARMMLTLNRLVDRHATEEMLGILADEAGYRPLALYLYDEWDCGLDLCASVNGGPAGLRERVEVGSGIVGRAARDGIPIFIDHPADAELGADAGLLEEGVAAVFALPLADSDGTVGVLVGAAPAPLSPRESGWLVQLAGQLAVSLRARRRSEELQLLSTQLTERTRRVAIQNRDLERASRMKSRFLATMSHELRTPLNAIIGFSEVLRDGLLGPLTDKQAEFIGEICDGGRHLLAVISDILDLSRMEAGQVELDVGVVVVQDLVDGALAAVRDAAARGGVDLSAEVSPQLGELAGDERRLRQALVNLLANAVKFTDPGGRVHLGMRGEDGDALMVVQDTGIGLAPDDVDAIFEPFVQLDSARARRFEGTGLGLTIVRRIVELHRGTVQVDSRPGVGTTVAVRLPGAVSPVGLAEARRRMEAVAGRPLFRSRIAARLGSDTTVSLVPDGPPRVGIICDDDAKVAPLTARLAALGLAPVSGLEPCEGVAEDGGSVDLVVIELSAIEQLSRLLAVDPAPDPAPALPVVVCAVGADEAADRCIGVHAVRARPIEDAELVALARKLSRRLAGRREAAGDPVVLAVDDSPRAIGRIISALEPAGFMVVPAFSGREAAALLRELRPDLAIVVIDDGDLERVALIDTLSSRPETADVPIIALVSGERSPRDDARLRSTIARALKHPRSGRPDLATLVSRLAGRRGNAS
ncbi:MAG: hypothetical protein D6798_14780 [Deltaproteobacteria bacterium]|nr:MAG: hypothetical protein D6798_14780 [Deltaproteobacteria bacterium]